MSGYLLGSYRIAAAPEPNSNRLTNLKSRRFVSPANDVGPWPYEPGLDHELANTLNGFRDGPAAESSSIEFELKGV